MTLQRKKTTLNPVRVKAYSFLTAKPIILDAVQRIHDECFGKGDFFSKEGRIKHELSLDDRNRLLVAWHKGLPIGYILVKAMPQADKLRGERLGVSRKSRREGIGTLLVAKALAYSTRLGCHYVTYAVNDNTASVRLHLNCGLRLSHSDRTYIFMEE